MNRTVEEFVQWDSAKLGDRLSPNNFIKIWKGVKSTKLILQVLLQTLLLEVLSIPVKINDTEQIRGEKCGHETTKMKFKLKQQTNSIADYRLEYRFTGKLKSGKQ